MRAIALPITASSTRCWASAPIEAPRSSTTNSPRNVGQRAAIAGRSMPAMVFRLNLAMAINAPVLPAETTTSASPLLDRIDGKPHRRLPTAIAERLARLVVHFDGDVGMDKAGRGLPVADGRQQWIDDRPIAEQDEFESGMPVSESSAPGTTTEGPWSPPMASSAMRTLSDMDRGGTIPGRGRETTGLWRQEQGHLSVPPSPFLSAARAANGWSPASEVGGAWKTAPSLRG